MKNSVRRVALLAACGLAAWPMQPVFASAVSRDDFAFPSDHPFKIAVFRPDVHVGSLKIGGLNEPNADWTTAARENIQKAMQAAPEVQNSNIQFINDFDGPNAELLEQYRGMFELVAGAMFTHITNPGNNLPSKLLKEETDPKTARKVKKYAIDWTLGDGAAQLKQATGADYAMFVYTYDAYGDSGRKTAQALGMLGCLLGACVFIQAGVHAGYAGLVDLSNGNVVWFNSDLAMGGDVRDNEGAGKRVEQLLRGFPAEGETMHAAVSNVSPPSPEEAPVAGNPEVQEAPPPAPPPAETESGSSGQQ